MGVFYQKLAQYASELDQDHIIVEIGSEMGEGSTDFICDLAHQLSIPFYSVDVFCAKHRVRAETVTDTIWQQMAGSVWARDVLPGLGKKIAMLYLDNFDYTWDINITTLSDIGSGLIKNIIVNAKHPITERWTAIK